jgi:putative tricarboxylic transport membrane protein
MAPGDPGGGYDTTARTLQSALRDDDLAPKGAEVYDVPGAGGTIGLSQFVSKQSGEPEQLMVMGLVMVGAIETNRPPVDLTRVTPIATLATEPEAIVVRAESKYRTLSQLLADLKRDPGSVSFGGGSAGGADHLLVGELARASRVDGAKVRYIAHSGGGETNAAILSGGVAAGVTGVAEIDEHVKAGKMRALATSTAEPIEVGGKPAPTLKDAGADVELSNWRGLVAPPGISAAERGQIIELVQEAHDTPRWQESLRRFGWTDFFKTGPEFDRFLREEIARVKGLVRDLGIEG